MRQLFSSNLRSCGLQASAVLRAARALERGLASKIVHQIFRIVLDLSKIGASVLLVEQNVLLPERAIGHLRLADLGEDQFFGARRAEYQYSNWVNRQDIARQSGSGATGRSAGGLAL